MIETGRTTLTGLRGSQRLTLALGFGSSRADARPPHGRRCAPAPERSTPVRGRMARVPDVAKAAADKPGDATERREYDVSAMVLAATEDKTFRGAFIASPTMPWVWGTGLENPSGPYHLGLVARPVRDRDRADRRRRPPRRAPARSTSCSLRQQQPDGSFPQNSDVTGKPVLDEPPARRGRRPDHPRLAARRHDATTYSHVKRAADFIVGWHDEGPTHSAPYTPQERWENQGGYSPATIAAEIAGLVCAADIAQHNGDTASATKYLQTADAWRAHLNAWTLTTTGPYGPSYYVRLTKDGDPNAGTTYSVGDSGPAAADQRAVVDPSFLELVRLGILPADDPNILSTIARRRQAALDADDLRASSGTATAATATARCSTDRRGRSASRRQPDDDRPRLADLRRRAR